MGGVDQMTAVNYVYPALSGVIPTPELLLSQFDGSTWRTSALTLPPVPDTEESSGLVWLSAALVSPTKAWFVASASRPTSSTPCAGPRDRASRWWL